MTKSAKFHSSIQLKWQQCLHLKKPKKSRRLQSWIMRETELISFLSPVEAQNMSAGKLIYFHYDVLLCLFSVFLIFIFLEQHFVSEATIGKFTLQDIFHSLFYYYFIFCCTTNELRFYSYYINRRRELLQIFLSVLPDWRD